MPPNKTKSSNTNPKKTKKADIDEDSDESDDQDLKKSVVQKRTSSNKDQKDKSKEQSGNKQQSTSGMKKIAMSESDSDDADKQQFKKQTIKKKVTKEIIVKEELSSEDEILIQSNTKRSTRTSNTSAKQGTNKKTITQDDSLDEEDVGNKKNTNVQKTVNKNTNKQENKQIESEETLKIQKRPQRQVKKISMKEDSDEDYQDEKDDLMNDETNSDFNESLDKFKNQKKVVKKQNSKVIKESDYSDNNDETEIENKKKKGGAQPEGKTKAVYSATSDIDSKNNHLIEVQKEQGKVELEDQYELPYFLNKQFLKDAEGRPVSDPNYDPSTLFYPIQELKKETPVFQQYWQIKMKHFDKVVFFRFGRNFMCYFNDAILMKRLFDCQIGMWGKRPVASIFDNKYPLYVKELLERADKSCIVVDQVEFSDEKENEQDIIKREVTQIITKGTYTDFIDNAADYNARYLMCIVESETDHSFGTALVDCTTHQIYLDDIKNDPAGNQIRTILRKMKPVEIYSVFNNLSEQTKNISKTTCKPQFTFNKTFEFYDLQVIFDELKNEFREKIPINPVNQVNQENKMEVEKPKKKNNDDNSDFSDDEIKSVESDESDEDDISGDANNEKKEPKFRYGELSSDYPVLLRDLEDMYNIDKKRFEEERKIKQSNKQKDDGVEEEEPCFDIEFQYYMMLQALMLMLTNLRNLKLNENVFRLGSFQLLDTTVQKNAYLHLDAHAIENLDIFEVNMQNKVTPEGSLMHFIDYTKTQFGKRMLKKWLAYPLKNVKQIEQRQEAIEDLMSIEPVVDQFDKRLSKLSDLERQISKVFNSSQKSRLKPTSFENFSNVRLKEAFSLVKDLKNLEDILMIFSDHLQNFKSNRLKQLMKIKDPEQVKKMAESNKLQPQPQSYLQGRLQNTGNVSATSSKSKLDLIGLFPDLKPFVDLIESQLELDDQGFCQPKAGADATYDNIILKLKKIYKKMNIEASFWRKQLNNFDIKLIKNKYQWEIQIPEKLVEGNKKPKELYLTSKVKAYQRFQSDVIIKLCNKLKKCEQALQKALSPFCERFFHQFYQNRDLLYQAVNCIGELDCLSSLAKCALKLDVRCKPTFIPESENMNVFELREMYHPQLLGKTQNLIPNDTIFENGVQSMLVTGPNMGGKSTLLRQTCLAVILAQLGCYLPARSFKTIIRDRIFCRIGASDRLMEGKSTFLVEMEETGDIVKEATYQSLVLLDELGRGTSTFDGVSIAYGVLRYLVDNIKCLTLFSTHYHNLVDEFQLYKSVESYVMDFDYEPIQKKMIFKYKYIKGSSDKSFGVNVAKMAGLPEVIVSRAHQKEQHMNSEDQNLGSIRKITRQFNSIVESCLNSEPEQLLSALINQIKI